MELGTLRGVRRGRAWSSSQTPGHPPGRSLRTKPSFPGLSVACHSWNLSIFRSKNGAREGGGGGREDRRVSGAPTATSRVARPASSERGLAGPVLGRQPQFSHKQREAKKWSLWITFFLFFYSTTALGGSSAKSAFYNSWERAGGQHRAPCCMLIQICL